MKKSLYLWTVVALLWVVAALNYVDRQVVFALFPLLRSSLHVTSVQLGLLATAFLWVYGIASPFGGYLADRFSRRKIILLSLAIWSAVTFLAGLARTYPQLLVAQALMGVSEACYLPAALALIADYHGEDTRSRAIGLHQSGLYAGVVLGGFGGGWIGQQYGWHRVFFVLGIFGLIYFVALLFGLKDAPERRRVNSDVLPFLEAMRKLSSTRSFGLLVVVVNCCAAIAFWCVYTWLTVFLFERFRVSLAVAGFSSTFYIQVASFAAVLGGGWLADAWSHTTPRGRVWTQIIGFLLAGPALFLTGAATSWWVLLPYLICFGIGRGFFDANLMPVLCQIVPVELRATAYGILNFTSCVAGGIMASASGVLKEHVGLGAALEISGVFLIVGALCLFALRINATPPLTVRNEA